MNFFKRLFGGKGYKDKLSGTKEPSLLQSFARNFEKSVESGAMRRSGNGFRKFKNTVRKSVKEKLRLPRFERPCKQCHRPMWVARGQIAYTHRACRTLYRRIYAH